MKKSFTRLLSLVMLFGLFFVFAANTASGIGQTKIWPVDVPPAKAYTKTTDKLMIIYPEAVVASTGSIRLSNTGGLVRVLPATDPRVSFAKGDTVEVDFSADLKELVAYTVVVDADAFKAADDGDPSAVISTWAFTVGDYTAPTLKEVKPVKGAVVDNQTTYTLEMTFEDNAAATLMMGTGKVSLYKADGNVWDLIDVVTEGTLAGNKLTLSSLRSLEDNTNYYVTIGAGVVTDNGLRADAKKNPYAGSMSKTAWTFSTKDFSIPNFASGYPKATNIGNTSVDILIKADEVGTAYALAVANDAGNPGAAAIKAANNKVTVAAVNTEYTIPVTNLGIASTSQDFDIWVIIENADVAALDAQAKKVDVKTSENTAPKLFVGVAVSYNKGTTLKQSGSADAANVVTNAGLVDQTIDNIVLKFDEKVKIGAGVVTIRKASDNSVFKTVDASALSVSSDVNVKIPVSGLANDAKYYVQMPNTLILDVYNNAYSGMSATTAWAFQTNDIIAPTFTIVPADGASGIKKDANIVVTFNELVNVTGTPFVVEVNGSSVGYALTPSTNDGKFSSFVINPTLDFASKGVVVLKILNTLTDKIADGGGNAVAIQGQGIVFVVEDYVGPVLTYDKPGAAPTVTNASATDPVVVKFNEPVYLAGGGEITDANLYTILVLKKTDASGVNVPYSATISADKKTITITPSSAWVSKQQYYVAVSSSLQDASGNAFDGTGRALTFTIKDIVPATVDLSSVDGKTISTTATVSMIFKEGSSVDARTDLYYNGTWNAYTAPADMVNVVVLKEGSATGPNVAFSVTNVAGDDANFEIVAALAGNKTYYLGVGTSTKGADGNVNIAKFVTFNTKYEGVPTVESLSPADNSKEVAKGSNFVITFNTDVEKVAWAPGDFYYTDGVTPVNIVDGEVTISGKVATINPTADLDNDKAYDIYVKAGIFKNKNSALANAEIALNAWDFETKDTKMLVATLTPDNNTSVAIDAKLEMTFGEKASIGTGYVDIINAATDAVVERINITSSQVVLSGDQLKVTITPTSNFKYNTSYYVEVTEGAIVDWVGNKTAAIYGKVADVSVANWTFTTADPAIQVVKVTPANGSDKIANSASIIVEFNREIVAGTGSAGYIEVGTPDQLQAYPIGSSNVTFSGKTMTITHADKVFPDNTQIYVYLQEGAAKAATNTAILSPLMDKTSVLNVPLNTAAAVSFHTGDVNAPVATVTPKAYAVTKVYEPVETNIVIEFDENVYNALDGTVITNADVTSGGIFTVNDGTGNKNFIGTIVGRVITLDPTSDLAENATVTVTLVAGKVKDVKNVINGGQVFTFQTIDKTAPSVTAVTATGGNKQIVFASTVADPNNKEIYLLIKPKADAAAPTVAEVKAGKKITVAAPSAAGNNTFTGLMASTAYEIFYVAVDTRGNTTAVAKVEATTDDTVAPLLVSTTPANGAVNVDVTTGGAVEVKLTFNENVQVGTGAITVRDYATQAILMTLSQANLSTVTSDAKSLLLTIPGVASISPDVMKIYVEIAKGTIKDQSTVGPNDYAGLFGMDALVLTTEDNKAPTVTGGSSGSVKLDADLTIEFSENVTGGSGTAILYKGAVDPANAVQVFYASDAVFSGKKATINPSANLVNGQAYNLVANAGFAKDLSSNANASVAGTRSFTGTTNPAPSVTVSPAGGSLAVAVGLLGTITATFDENIYLPVAGNLKPLILLTQAELLANISLVDAANAVVPIATVTKTGAASFTLTVTATLKHESSYKLTIGGFQDVDGQVMTTSVTNYKTSDGLAPSIVFSPLHKTTSVDVASKMTLTFSEKIFADVISANDSVWANVDNTNVETFVFLRKSSTGGTNVPFTATISGNVITITPKAALESAVRYYFGLIKPVEDINGQILAVDLAGTGENKVWAYFDSKDVVKPALPAVTAGDYAPLGNGISPTATMWVNFTEDVLVSTGAVVIRREDGTIFQKVSGAGLSIHSTIKNRLVVAHNAFENVTNYFVELEGSVVVDKSGNPNVAWSDPVNGWLFSTKETRDVQITSLSPLGDNTPRSAELKINFDKVPVAGAGKYVAVYKEDGTAVYQIATSSMMINGMTASFPGINLDADQAYYARIEPKGFSDAYGNNFSGLMDNTWVFSTVNNIAPEVDVLMPADNKNDVNPATDFTMVFSRDIKAGSGKIAVRKSVDGTLVEEVDVANTMISGNTLTFKLTTLLADNTAYYVIVPAGAVTNTEVTNDPFKGILNTYTWNFTTGVYVCDPIKLTTKVVEQKECSAVIEVAVESANTYVLTMNGKEITAGTMTVDAGTYNFVVKVSDVCSATGMLTVVTKPVTRNVTVEAFLNEPAKFVDAESGIDTMLAKGVHTLKYKYMGCDRTLVVTVTEVIMTPKIAEIQGAGDATTMEGKKVKVVATVTAVAPGEGFFMQDANAVRSGIWVEFTGATYEGIQVGNGVTVIGTVSEVANVTSIVAETVTFTPPVVTVVPLAVQPSAVADEKYESVLVFVEGARAQAANATTGEWVIHYADANKATVNDWLYKATPVAKHYYDVKGVVSARLDAFKIEPRMESDVKDITITNVDPNLGVAFKVYPNPFNDKIYIDNNDKLVRVVISNIAGQRVIDVEYPEREIRTGTLVSGVYLVNLFTEKGLAKTERIVKR